LNGFAGKVAIVTGGGMGLGRALCEELARREATVISADVKCEAAESVAEKITDGGGRARAVGVDVSNRDAMTKLVDDVVSEFGGIDYIFNNAAIVIGGDTRDLTIEQYDKVLAVDLHGVLYGSLAAYHAMVRQGFGHIVNISSLGGLVPQPGNTSYSTSKWGVVGLSLGLRFEGADLGVKVSCVCPGDMKTDIYDNMTVINMDRQEITRESRRSHFLFPQWTAQRAARVICDGVSRNKAMIVFPMIGRMAWRMQRWFPEVIYWITLRRVRMVRKVRDRYLAAHHAN
jgi:NAD(P)-dependent dehydrogenase (short-subunit alcohol dehydrogenase family)